MKTFFLAEDDPLMCRLYKRAFELAGHKLEVACDGEDALTELTSKKEPPSVVILDVMMPKVNGFEVLTKLKSDDKYKETPIVLLTNLAGDEDKKKGLSLGADEYMVKSEVSPEEVVEKITTLAK